MKRILQTAALLFCALLLLDYLHGGGQAPEHAGARPAQLPAPTFEPQLLVATPVNIPAPRHQAFPVAPLPKAGARLGPDDWKSSAEVSPRRELTVYVIASWCPYCEELISKINQDSDLRSRIDMLLVYEDEAEAKIDNLVIAKELEKQKGEKIKKHLAKDGQFLLKPKTLMGNLTYYVIKKGQFKDLVEGFPTAIRCTPRGCNQIERLDI
ncbi:hypothetical protein WMF30_51620 [Sorangium sp. So ce134]